MPTPTYTPLATITLGSAQSSVTFASIPNTFRDLIIVVNWRNSGTASATRMTFNADDSSNYSNVAVTGIGSGNGSSGSESGTSMRVFGSAIGPSTSWQTGIIQLMDYSATNKHKTALVRHSDVNGDVHAVAGRWQVNSAIFSVRLFDVLGQNFQVGATFSLYGVAA